MFKTIYSILQIQKRVTACTTKSILEVMLKKLLQLKYISFNYVFQSVRQCHLDQSFQIAGTNCHNTLYIINFQKIGLAQVNFHESDIFLGLTDKNLCHSHENQLV